MTRMVPGGMKHRDWLPLIRCSHVISSVVGEILESDALRAAGGENMTPRQMDLLEFIAGSSPHIDDVARFLGITPPAATKAVDKLERRGLVVRGACAGDRRLTMLSCSETGHLLVARYRSLQEQLLAGALRDFAEQDVDELATLLERYAVALRSTREHET